MPLSTYFSVEKEERKKGSRIGHYTSKFVLEDGSLVANYSTPIQQFVEFLKKSVVEGNMLTLVFYTEAERHDLFQLASKIKERRTLAYRIKERTERKASNTDPEIEKGPHYHSFLMEIKTMVSSTVIYTKMENTTYYKNSVIPLFKLSRSKERVYSSHLLARQLRDLFIDLRILKKNVQFDQLEDKSLPPPPPPHIEILYPHYCFASCNNTARTAKFSEYSLQKKAEFKANSSVKGTVV